MSSYRVVDEHNVKELAKEFTERYPNIPDFNKLEEDFKEARMRHQYVMLVTDDRDTWWRFTADIRFGSDLVFDYIKKELNL